MQVPGPPTCSGCSPPGLVSGAPPTTRPVPVYSSVVALVLSTSQRSTVLPLTSAAAQNLPVLCRQVKRGLRQSVLSKRHSVSGRVVIIILVSAAAQGFSTWSGRKVRAMQRSVELHRKQALAAAGCTAQLIKVRCVQPLRQPTRPQPRPAVIRSPGPSAAPHLTDMISTLVLGGMRAPTTCVGVRIVSCSSEALPGVVSMGVGTQRMGWRALGTWHTPPARRRG